MAIFFENPIPVLAIGVVLITLCGLIFLSKRNLPTLFALIGVVMLTVLLLIGQWYVVTESEAVEMALAELLVAIEANETPAAVALIDPAAENLRADVELLMPMINVSDSGASSLVVEVANASEPLQATCRFRGKLQGVHSSSGMQVFYFDDVEMTWVKRNDNWLLQDFVAYFKGKPLNAVKSAQGNRIAPAGR